MWTVNGRTDGQKSVHRGLSTRMVSVTSNDLRVWLSDCWILPQMLSSTTLIDHCPLSPDSSPRRPLWNHLRSANWALGGTSNAEILQPRFFSQLQNFETLNLLKLSFEKITCRALTLFVLFTCLTWNMSFNIHPSSLFDWWFRTNLKKGWSTNVAHYVRHVHYAKRKSPRGELKAFVLIISSFVCRKIIFNCEKSVFKMPRACGQSISEILLPARF